MCDKYNGWTNFETWALNLHITNNQGDYNYFIEIAKQNDVAQIEEELKYWTEDIFSLVHDGQEVTNEARMLVQDVGSYWRINWWEIAESLKQIADEIIGQEGN